MHVVLKINLILFYILGDPINQFNPATFLKLSQSRTWISNVICRGRVPGGSMS